jgi:SM-20-related protein
MTIAESENPFDRLPSYHVVHAFLGEELIERLLECAKKHENNFLPTKVGLSEGSFDPEIRISRVLRDFPQLRTELSARFRQRMPQAIHELGLSPFELAGCEIELVAHGDGAFYKRHIDTATGIQNAQTQRVLTGVLYFHTLPKAYTGGELRLHAFSSPERGERFVDIEPERDKLVLFPSWAPHEVLPIVSPGRKFEDSRFAINCWFLSKKNSHSPA